MKIIAASTVQAITEFLHIGYTSAGYDTAPGEVATLGGLLTSEGAASWPDISAMVIALAIVFWALSPLVLSARTIWKPPDNDKSEAGQENSNDVSS